MSGPGAHESLRAALAGAVRRWRARRALEGACVLVACLAVAGVIAIAVMDAHRFLEPVVAAVRVAVYTAGAVLAALLLVLRVPWWRDGRALARHLEARDPSLDALLVTAVQVHGEGGDSTLEERLFRRAAAACDDPFGATREDRTRVRRFGALLVVLFIALLLALLGAGPAWRHGAALLALPFADARDGMPYAVVARPGAATVLENGDLAVSGAARGFAPGEMTLVHRSAGEWTRTPMTPGTDGTFEALLGALSEPTEYYLEAETVRSATHRVDVQRLPRIDRMTHRYRYPAYTGLGEREVEDATAIAAVAGTRVEVRVVPAAAPGAGELVLDDDRRRPLEPDGDALTASLLVDEASRYRIELALPDGARVAVTPDHPVDALADGAPSVSVVRPGGDTRATPVEELELEVQAEDDVNLRRLELVLSVNGQPEEVLDLGAGGTGPVVTAVHTLRLEERGLAPGDLIAVHARASDGVEARTAVTDIQFLEVRPFDRDYSRGRSGGRGGSGRGEDQDGLAAQQRDLVVALFRLARDAARLSGEEQAERLTTLSDAQARIRGRVEAIVRRLQGRPMVQSAPGYRVMLEEMPRATAAMLRVEALLAVPAPEEALPPAREALAHLQRADAAFREVRVAAQQGGGGGGRADNNDLSRLFELEMDRFRNRYSDVQRAPPEQQRQREVDEAIEKLKALARRQQEEVERARRRAGRSDLSGRGGATQQQLAAALDELLRRLERLTRERPSAGIDAARRALEEAAQAMRRSAGADGGGADAAQAARDALERLRRAGEALSGEGPAQVARELDEAQRRAESLAERQRRMREQVARGPSPDADPNSPQRPNAGDARGGTTGADAPRQDGAGARPDAMSGETPGGRAGGEAGTGGRDGARAGAGGSRRALEADKARMEADAAALREQLDRIAGSAGRALPDAAQGARAAASVMREEDVEGRLRRSREELAAGVPDPGLEDAIGRALDRVRERVAQAAQAAQATGEGASARAGAQGPPTPDRLRALMRELAELRERTERGAAGGFGPGGRGADALRALAGTLDRLRGPVARNGDAIGDLDALISGIEALAAEDGRLLAGGPERDAFLESLAGVERAIGEAVNEAAADLIRAGRDAQAPPRYRALVEDYYRRLGRDGAR